MSYQSLQLSRQVISEPGEVMTGDILAIERDGFAIILDDLNLREDYPKPELVKRTMEMQIRGEIGLRKAIPY